MAVKLLKLVSGEELIADVEEYSDGFELKKPVQVAMTPEGVAFVPFMPLAEETENGNLKVLLLKEHIMVQKTPVKELANGYSARFGTGLVLP